MTDETPLEKLVRELKENLAERDRNLARINWQHKVLSVVIWAIVGAAMTFTVAQLFFL